MAMYVACAVIFVDNVSHAIYRQKWATTFALRDDVDGHVILRGRTSGPQIEQHCAIDSGSVRREHCRAVCACGYPSRPSCALSRAIIIIIIIIIVIGNTLIITNNTVTSAAADGAFFRVALANTDLLFSFITICRRNLLLQCIQA